MDVGYRRFLDIAPLGNPILEENVLPACDAGSGVAMKAIAISRFVETYPDLQISEVPHSPDQILVDITHAGSNHVDLLYARSKTRTITADSSRRHLSLALSLQAL